MYLFDKLHLLFYCRLPKSKLKFGGLIKVAHNVDHFGSALSCEQQILLAGIVIGSEEFVAAVAYEHAWKLGAVDHRLEVCFSPFFGRQIFDFCCKTVRSIKL